MNSRLPVIMLAAGQSRRYRAATGRHKLFEPLADGTLMIQASCRAVLAQERTIVVVTNPDTHARIAECLDRLPVRVSCCVDAARGMGAPLRHGLHTLQQVRGPQTPQSFREEYLRQTRTISDVSAEDKHARARAELPGVMITLGDLPWLQPATVEAVEQAIWAGALAARPRFDGSPGHPVAFSSRLIPELANLPPTEGARGLLRSIGKQLAFIDCADPGCVQDVDTPDQLSRAGA